MAAPSAEALCEACDQLAARDPVLAKAYTAIGLPTWRSIESNYQSLARIVVYQLISTKAADAIWARVHGRYADMSAQAVLEDDQEALRACGLSRPKLSHLDAMANAPITAARKQLLAVKGIGPWTADTFLMNAYGHLDAFPAGDVGLIEAHKRLSDAETRLTAKAFTEHAESWRPYRGVAAHLLYDWYNSTRN